MLPQALAEAEASDIGQKIDKLQVDRAVEPELLSEEGTLRGGALHRQHRRDGIADHAGDEKHPDGHAENYKEPVVKAFDDEGTHRGLRPIDPPGRGDAGWNLN